MSLYLDNHFKPLYMHYLLVLRLYYCPHFIDVEVESVKRSSSMSNITGLVSKDGFSIQSRSVLQTLKHRARWPQKQNKAATMTIKFTKLVFGEMTLV